MTLLLRRSGAFALVSLLGSAPIVTAGCSGDASEEAGTGGVPGAPGGAATGGSTVTGGTVGNGGVNSGGVANTGSIAGATGGSIGTGGGSTGGSFGGGGARSTGGSSSTGGAQPSGGTAGTGGVPSTGGAASTGGARNGPGIVGQRGALRVSGNRIVDAAGQAVQLRGMSLFWSQWSRYHLAGTVDQLVDDWKATIVRAPLGVEEAGGYLQSPAENEAKVVAIADRAIQRGVYVIVDWHDHHGEAHQSAATDFFTRMARKYGTSPAVIFEIYNEPLNVSWSTVKSYAETVIAAVRATGAKNLVIVGTPNWSQDVDVAARSPITADPNVAYTLHFYAATHRQALRDKARAALDARLPLFATEWGTCEASGNGAVDQNETRTWLDFLSQNQISWTNWALNDKAESCSALTQSAGTAGPWSGSALTASGALVKPLIR